MNENKRRTQDLSLPRMHLYEREREEETPNAFCGKEEKVINQLDQEKIAKEKKVIPDPIDDRKFQE